MIVDAGVSYRFRPAASKFAHTIRLNVKNLADRDYIDTQKKPGDRRGFYVSYAVNH